MAAPSLVARGTPAGIQLTDGYSTTIALENLTTISFWETDVAPPPIDGGEPIDLTTHHNATYRTFASRSLKTLEPFDVTAGYDPNVYSQVLAQINIVQSITVTLPDGSTLTFWGFLRRMVKAGLVEGTMPTLVVTFVPTNRDPSDGSEAGPAYVDVSGT